MKKFSFVLILCISLIFANYKNTDNFNGSNLIPIENLNEFNNKKNIIVYFGRPTCPICTEFSPILESVLKSENKKIYYFDTDEWRDKKGYETILKLYEINNIPTLIKIHDINSFDKLDLFDYGIDFLDNTNKLKQTLKNFIN